MSEFVCKNGCSGKKGFNFSGKVLVHGSVDGDEIHIEHDEDIEIFSYECFEFKECSTFKKGKWIYMEEMLDGLSISPI